jgi:hypothetical protein
MRRTRHQRSSLEAAELFSAAALFSAAELAPLGTTKLFAQSITAPNFA